MLLKKLKNWLERIKALDFYRAPARVTAERKLAECEQLLESYTNEVFEREQSLKLVPSINSAGAKKLGAKNPMPRKTGPKKMAKHNAKG